jgi:signal peptidase I
MELTQSPGIAETLANLSVAWILTIVAGLTVLRLGLIRVPTPGARSFAEILESGIIAIVLVFLIIRPFILQAYFIPSPSMEPTLLGKNNVGDRILVNKFLYRFHPPQRDDVVVFLAPPAAMEGNPDFIKRLIGTPGDVVTATHGWVEISGTPFDHAELRDKLGHAGEFGPDAMAEGSIDQADHHVKIVADGVLADGRLIDKDKLKADLGMPEGVVTIHPGYTTRNGQRMAANFAAEDPDYDLQIFQGRPLKHDFGQAGTEMEYKLGPLPDQATEPQSLSQEQYEADANAKPEPIPPHEFLMMGDNRNDSNDGTNWGLLPEKRVVGRAQFIFWPLTRMHPIR